MKVFISYSSNDKEFVLKLAADLKTAQVDIWLDQIEIKIGDTLINRISEGIQTSDYLIAVLSKNSIKSNWVQKELSLAMTKEINGKSIVVLPIIIDEVELPFFLRDKLYADFSTGNFIITAREFDKLIRTILQSQGFKSETSSHNVELEYKSSKVGDNLIGNLINVKRDSLFILKLPKKYLLTGFITTGSGGFIFLSSFLFRSALTMIYIFTGTMLMIVGWLAFYLSEKMNKLFTIDKTLLLKAEEINSVVMPFSSNWFKRYHLIKDHKVFKRLFILEAVAQGLLLFTLIICKPPATGILPT